MKIQQCPACGHKINLKQAAATKKVKGTFMLQCGKCKEWSHECQRAAILRNVGSVVLIIGSVMGYFQLGGVILGPLIALAGVLLALTTLLFASRVIYSAP
ncbi:hypothetical protein WG68_08350 [Arsukibacterium ikkense]|uniref:Uncharacterized protein n=1 Tax=Arsukibacterium ikkense TaxID=336831 RepID=A0A0M2V981_9GAMM|nr:hypothetical protein WG68_08350 [Arsukibacterium ikkense]